MTTKIKTTLLLLTLLSAMIYLAGCKKTNDSIVGTWNYNNGMAGFSYIDTPYNIGSYNTYTGNTVTFNGNNTFSISGKSPFANPFTVIDSNENISGTYSYTNDTLILNDALYPTKPAILKVITLNTHNLTFFSSDSGAEVSGEYFIVVSHFSR